MSVHLLAIIQVNRRTVRQSLQQLLEQLVALHVLCLVLENEQVDFKELSLFVVVTHFNGGFPNFSR